MILPKSVRVGYRDYAVNEYDARMAEAERQWGWHSSGLHEIQVRLSGLRDSEIANTLLHEVLHAAYQVADIKQGDDEERTVTAIANQLTQVWRDNPELIAFISDALTPQPSL